MNPCKSLISEMTRQKSKRKQSLDDIWSTQYFCICAVQWHLDTKIKHRYDHKLKGKQKSNWSINKALLEFWCIDGSVDTISHRSSDCSLTFNIIDIWIPNRKLAGLTNELKQLGLKNKQTTIYYKTYFRVLTNELKQLGLKNKELYIRPTSGKW